MVMRRDLETGFTAGAEAPGYLTSVAADPRRPGAPLLAASDADANCPPYTHGRQRLHRLRHLQFQLRPLQPW